MIRHLQNLPYAGYEIYFEKMLAYGFFPSFFSVNASSDPYWRDMKKIENGRPFFKKYIPVIKKIAAAGWEPVTYATVSSDKVRIERFGNGDIFFTLRNIGSQDQSCIVTLDPKGLDISGNLAGSELLTGDKVKVKGNKMFLEIPAGRTRVIQLSLTMTHEVQMTAQPE